MEKIKRYPSIASLARDAEAVKPFHLSLMSGGAYFGHESAEDSIRLAISGDTSRVAAAEKLLSQINAEIDVPERPWIADCAGAYPVVPDFLAGMPDCMRRRDTVESDAAPVRIFHCIEGSMALSADQMMRRGCAVLALVMALSRVRPVELLVYCSLTDDRGNDSSVIAAPINSTPLDLATAAYALTSAGFVRRLVYNLARHHHFGRRRCGLDYPRVTGAAVARALGGSESDLVTDRGSYSDPLINDPVAWVNAQLARYREGVQ